MAEKAEVKVATTKVAAAMMMMAVEMTMMAEMMTAEPVVVIRPATVPECKVDFASVSYRDLQILMKNADFNKLINCRITEN